LSGIRLVIEADQWWRGRIDGRLVVDVTRVEPEVDEDGSITWAVVEGWRVLPDGGRSRTRELVRASALPPMLLPDAR
jgi:hypothetical protein